MANNIDKFNLGLNLYKLIHGGGETNYFEMITTLQNKLLDSSRKDKAEKVIYLGSDWRTQGD